MLNRIGGGLGVLILLSGCGAYEGDGAESENIDSVEQALTGPTVYFQTYAYGSSNGAGAVERFAECSPDQVMTGFGGRVSGDNFLEVTVFCRDILPNGSLSVNETTFSSGGTAQEKAINADSASVVIGIGGIVSGDNVNRLVIRQCPWISATKRVDVLNCSYKSTSPGSNSTEAFFNTHDGYSSSQKPRVVGAGAGMTSTGDNVFAVRMVSGYLK